MLRASAIKSLYLRGNALSLHTVEYRDLMAITVLHDLAQVYRAFDKVLLLNSGKVVVAGNPKSSGQI
jgi:ABC-type cobalamin/Fe3+-siderophores transport system ATPase subunit